MLRTLLSLVRPGSTVVDAGGNIGSYTAHFAAQTGPTGRVYAFEPQRKMFMILCANAAVNSLLNVFPQNAALSFAPGEISMSAKVPDGSSAGVSIEEAESAHALVNYGGMSMGVGGEKARAVTLDSFSLSDVSLIKVDVQGAEPLMFYGARETIKRNLPAVAYEKTPSEFTVSEGMKKALSVPEEVARFDFEAFFSALNYSSHRISGSDVLLLPPGHPAGERVGKGSLQWGVDPVVVPTLKPDKGGAALLGGGTKKGAR
jgi:FkbM family methyltransferase